VNVGKLVLGDPTGFKPATPYGVQQILMRSEIPTRGAQVVIVGRSHLVGRPLANLLSLPGAGGDATVTLAHSRTRDLEAVCRTADILVVAIGRAEFIRGTAIKPGATVIDVGTTRVADPTKARGYRLAGDVAFDEAREVAGAITPVPGGVGPMTIAMLLVNTLQAASAGQVHE
jgi:methylenetetrahydrofolate dehydrogenase (NADP+)/methenyltetrahydrofolate cyclohydrolase